LVEIALRYPRVAATLGLFNNKENSNNGNGIASDVAAAAADATDGQVVVEPSVVVVGTQPIQPPQARRSFLDKDVKLAATPQDVNTASLAVNANKLRQQLSKTR